MNKDSEIVNLIVIRLLLQNKIYHWQGKYEFFTADQWKAFVKEKTDLFLNHNLPTIKAQTNQDFDYLVFVDPEFPEYDCVRDSLESNSSSYVLQYTDMPWGDGYGSGHAEKFVVPMQKAIYDYVHKNYPKCNWLTTQRIDSDDLICNDFVESVVNRFEKKEQWIIFETGYTYIRPTPYRPGGIFTLTDYQSPHPTYCEPFTQDIKTVYHRMHNKLGVTRGENMVLVPGGAFRSSRRGVYELNEPWSKGYWMDYAAYDYNICKDPKRSVRWNYIPLSARQRKNIMRTFTLSKEIACELYRSR